LKNVIVIGGGLAGLAAGGALAEAGCRVRLFEQRPFLGGRATSYVLPDGEHIDNCQHVTLGCCTNLSDFYSRVGAAHKIKFFDRLLFLDPQERRGIMQAGMLPAPFHMMGSFAAFSPLAFRDKLSIARAMLSIIRHRGHPPDIENTPVSMLDWLRRQGQTQRAIDRFWRVVLISALDEELDKTDARYGVDVFWKAFLSNRTGYRIGIPAVPLADLYNGCRVAIQQKGGEVILRSPARSVRIDNSACTGVEFDEGREENAEAYILAVPHSKISDLLPADLMQAEPVFKNLENLTDAPITGVHLWFDREVMTEPFVTLLDTHTQWIFNKSARSVAADESHPDHSDTRDSSVDRRSATQYLQLVISASYDLLQEPRQKIIDLCLAEVRQAIPAARNANLIKATVIKEPAATFSPMPGIDRWRPPQRSPVSNLFLAGDWTATGWPATMEGAVRSGYLAAEAVLVDFGAPRSFLQPDLPPDGLVSLWARGPRASRQP
jgi:squalene-associated FAD-dependent desaturase